ncbi:MAG: PAS domain S-box protein [Ignavibacteria bacterium]|jgi:PAS domain S-box-containing protein|nr:PAS domain S-box protein [Ignavibacteria bacterium]MCU7504913.1 PAS domain S-box protein [Ignavibacteria bacterium]MCU7517795.1 PAS domain S-box protein [Ignavibacteria bacterium]
MKEVRNTLESLKSLLNSKGRPNLVFKGLAEILTEIEEVNDMKQVKVLLLKYAFGLVRSESGLFSVWENLFDGMRIIDSQGVILSVNSAFCRLVCKKEKELVGMHYLTVYDFSMRDELHVLGREMFREKNAKVKLKITLWNGKKLDLEISTIKLEYETGNPAFLTMFHDITENEAVKEQLQAEKEDLSITLKSIGDGVITTDSDDNISTVNNAAEKILGLKQNLLKGKTLFEIFELIRIKSALNSDQYELQAIQGSSAAARQQNNEVFIIYPQSGNQKVVTFSSFEKVNQEGCVTGFVYVLRDVTEQIKLERQLNLAQKMESLGQLVSGIAHEINTPMQYIGDNNAFLMESFQSLSKFITEINEEILRMKDGCSMKEFLTEKRFAFEIGYLLNEIPAALEQSLNGIERVNGIISALKDFAHPGGKAKTLSNINRGIEVTASISKNEWKYVADMEMILDPELPLVYCSIDEFNQVILNLIVNAAHAIQEKTGKHPAEKGKITIKTKIAGDKIEVTLEDTGTGIAPENISRIFDPFFTTKPVGVGTGQGLSIAHNIIVKKHKGELFAESELGKGSKFIIRLRHGNN